MRLQGFKAIDLIFNSRHQKLIHSFCIAYQNYSWIDILLNIPRKLLDENKK